MNRLQAVSVLVALGSIAIVAVLTSPLMPATSMPQGQQSNRYHGALASTSGITCNVNITTTDMILNNQTTQTAALVATYIGLSFSVAMKLAPFLLDTTKSGCTMKM